MSCVRVALLLLASGAGSALTLPALPSTLPLLHFNLDKFLLPGESRRLRIVKAESLTALDAALANGDNLLGSLITTPAGNALSTASVLHVREVRRHPALGATVDVVAVGRAHLDLIDFDRSFVGEDVTAFRDGEHAAPPAPEPAPAPEPEDAEAAEAAAAAQAVAVAAKAAAAAVDNAPCWDAPESLERLWQVQAAAKFREELCALDLDAPPAEDLSAFHELWGAENEAEAASQLLSFAACRSLSAFQRSRALGMTSAAERHVYARKCRRKAAKKAAAEVAIRDALAPTAS